MNAIGVLFDIQEVLKELKEQEEFPDTMEAHLVDKSG